MIRDENRPEKGKPLPALHGGEIIDKLAASVAVQKAVAKLTPAYECLFGNFTDHGQTISVRKPMNTNSDNPKVERRHHQRVAFNSDATLQTIGAKAIAVRTRNISVGGLSVLTSQEIAPDTRCKIHVAIPDSSSDAIPVELVARVVSCNYNKIEGGFMLGCEFINLTANVAATIARFMHSR